MDRTYYEVLGVSSDASQSEITEAYRERVLETHPDRNDDPDSTDELILVTEAEDVLSDERERSRYDRLGHEAYVRLESDGLSFDDLADSDDEEDDAHWSESVRDAAGSASDPEASSTSGPSHHARRRRQRQRRTSDRTEWFFGDESGTSAGRKRRTRANVGPGPWVSYDARTDVGRDDHWASTNNRRGSYAVHDWEGDIDLGRSAHPLDNQSLFVVACVATIYPLLVYGSVTTAFPPLFNVIIAVCTLLLVGYLLTIPRVAVIAFGFWSLVIPVAIPYLTSIDPVSIFGFFIASAFWVPFGYALAIWWVLQP